MTRFYCENCGRRVSEKDEVCPHCGAFFTAIKCPHCGYRGKAHEFHNGCPKCGYLADQPPVKTKDGASDPQRPGTAGAGRSGVSNGRFNFWGKATSRKKKKRPEWLFFLIVGIMLVAFIVLSVLYMNL